MSYRFSVSAGLLTADHKRRIGPAIWEFLWMVEHETRQGGKVLNGAPIPLTRISTDLGQHRNTTSRNLARLVKEGYITQQADSGNACRYTVCNSKKWRSEEQETITKNGDTPPNTPTPEMVRPHTKNGVTPTPEMVRPHTKNGVGNKELDRYTKSDREREATAKPRPPHPPSNGSADSVKYARQILADLVHPAAPENLNAVIASVECEVGAGKSLDEARAFIVGGTREANKAGYPTSKFMFIDALYRIENRKKPVKTFVQMRREATNDTYEQVSRLIAEGKFSTVAK